MQRSHTGEVIFGLHSASLVITRVGRRWPEHRTGRKVALGKPSGRGLVMHLCPEGSDVQRRFGLKDTL